MHDACLSFLLAGSYVGLLNSFLSVRFFFFGVEFDFVLRHADV